MLRLGFLETIFLFPGQAGMVGGGKILDPLTPLVGIQPSRRVRLARTLPDVGESDTEARYIMTIAARLRSNV
jgi:hypothetical protein